jgi:hypothetical protein
MFCVLRQLHVHSRVWVANVANAGVEVVTEDNLLSLDLCHLHVHSRELGLRRSLKTIAVSHPAPLTCAQQRAGWQMHAVFKTVTEDNCCFASCATYKCTAESWVANVAIAGSATVPEDNSCHAQGICTAYTCTKSGWVADAANAASMTVTEDNCCLSSAEWQLLSCTALTCNGSYFNDNGDLRWQLLQ